MFRTVCVVVGVVVLATMVVVCGDKALEDSPSYSSASQPLIYGTDDRKEYWESRDSVLKGITRGSLAALVVSMNDLSSGNTIGDEYLLCPNEKFRNQLMGAYCTGTLIDTNLILTAAHCVDQDEDGNPDNSNCAFGYPKFIFGNYFQGSSESTPDRAWAGWENPNELKEYSCGSIKTFRHEKDSWGRPIADWAIVQVDRPPGNDGFESAVIDFVPEALRVGDTVGLTGFPAGIPAKLVSGGVVTFVGESALVSNLDIFKGDSGGPIIGPNDSLVGVASGIKPPSENFEWTLGLCYKWGVSSIDPGSFFGFYSVYARDAIEDYCDGHNSASAPRLCGGICETCGAGRKPCDQNHICADGNCLPRCDGGRTCPSGWSCAGTTCWRNTRTCQGNNILIRNGCSSTTISCGANETCQGGECVSACGSPCAGRNCGTDPCGNYCGPCSSGWTCSSGVCVASTWCGDGVCNGSETCTSCTSDCHCGTDCTCSAPGILDHLDIHYWKCGVWQDLELYEVRNGVQYWSGDYAGGRGVYSDPISYDPQGRGIRIRYRRISGSGTWRARLWNSAGYDRSVTVDPSTGVSTATFWVPMNQADAMYRAYMDTQAVTFWVEFFDCSQCNTICDGRCGRVDFCDCPACSCGTCENSVCVNRTCDGKECGSDGCGGSCPPGCAGNEVCSANHCVCVPNCGGKECGPDGCGGSCGPCVLPKTCNASGICSCTPNCTNRRCGFDGCFSTCAPGCAANEVCSSSGQCVCMPNCAGKECGSDGCGGSCGNCIDNNVCNGTETCSSGTCRAGTSLNCNDGNACTTDSCDPSRGCLHTTTTCNDGNRCTTDSCDRSRGCIYTPVANGTLCPDGICRDGECQASASIICSGTNCHSTPSPLPDNVTAQRNWNPCSEGRFFWVATGQFEIGYDRACVGGIATASLSGGCSAGTELNGTGPWDGNESGPVIVSLATDGSVRSSGIISLDAICAECFTNSDCSDDNICNGAETCSNGTCQTGTPLDCDDGVACTVDACDEGVGACVSVPNAALCQDGLFCNGAESCDPVLGCVVGTSVMCDDGIACTVDACNEGARACVSVPNAASCQDGFLCNGVESCHPFLGCVVGTPVANGTSCSDGNPCNGAETCSNGTCRAGTPLNCNDNNICTADSCNSSRGCVHSPAANGASCSDNHACNGAETCFNGVCRSGTPLDCDDGIACTVDACDEGVGACVSVPNAALCQDGLFCNGAESCDPVLGCVVGTPVANGTSCSDGNPCNGAEVCQRGECRAGTPLNCDDSDQCTTDRCDSARGCTHTANTGGLCDDGDACTLNERCSDGECVGHGTADCNDHDQCTTDTCKADRGCVHTPIPDCGQSSDGAAEGCGCRVSGNQKGSANTDWVFMLILGGLLRRRHWRKRRGQ